MKKRKGTITIRISNGNYPYGVDFDGFQEGSGSPCENEEEVNKILKELVDRHSKDYDLTIIDERKKEMQMTL